MGCGKARSGRSQYSVGIAMPYNEGSAITTCREGTAVAMVEVGAVGLAGRAWATVVAEAVGLVGRAWAMVVAEARAKPPWPQCCHVGKVRAQSGTGQDPDCPQSDRPRRSADWPQRYHVIWDEMK
jgi:hypothetical protein